VLRRLRSRELRSDGDEVQVVVGYEAGYDGFWLQRRLAAEGITCWVMDPAACRWTAGRGGPRPIGWTRRCCCGPDGVVPRRSGCLPHGAGALGGARGRAAHPPRAQRLIAERVQHVNRIKGLLATQGIYDYQPLRRDRWERLEELRTGDGRVLPLRLRREIEREIKRLELVLEQVDAIEAERDAAVAAPAPEDADAGKVALLSRLGGIGTELATVLVREGLHRPLRQPPRGGRLRRAHAQSVRQRRPAPGPRHLQGGQPAPAKEHGRTRLALAALPADSGLARWFTERVGAIRGRVRKITAVALARKLLVALWKYVTTGLVPEGARLKPAR
jgi:transposase